MRKRRSDAILLNLPEEQQAKLADWLLTGVPYHEAKVLIEKEFGITFKSLDPFKPFWRDVCVPLLIVRRSRGARTADARAEAAQKDPAQFDAATIDALKQKAYELSENPDAKLKDVKAVLGLILKWRTEDRADRELAFERSKFEWDASEACLKLLPELKAISSDSKLTEPQKIEQIRLKLFGAAVQPPSK